MIGAPLTRTLCVILGGGAGTRLYPLTRERAKPAVPLGGKYRLIDVPISNCLNSGLNQIYVVTQFLSESLHRHVKSTYLFDRFSEGFVEILAAQQRHESDSWYQGTADAVRQNKTHLRDVPSDEILILSGDQLYRMDFRLLLENHRRTEADASIAVLPVPALAAPELGILKVDSRGRVVSFVEKPRIDQLEGWETDPDLFEQFGVNAEGRPYLASMGIYVFNTNVLFEELLNNDYKDFGKNLFPAAINTRKIQAYIFDGYWEDIGTVRSFHEANLELAATPPKFTFQSDQGPIFTRSRMLPPTVARGKMSCNASLIAEGCILGSVELDRTILGIRSVVGDNVKLVRTLVMGNDSYETAIDKARNQRFRRPDMGIGDNVVIENAIVDKDVRIGSNCVLIPPTSGSTNGEFFEVRDGVLCIFKGAVVPDGTRIGA
jgi:glucose-1-phosphate adenylyltransferase